MLIERYTTKRRQANCCDRTKRQQQLAPMLIVSSKQDGADFSAASDCSRHCLVSLFFFSLSPNQASDVFPICQDQMTQHHFETRAEPQPLPVYQIWKWDKSMRGFHLEKNLVGGEHRVSRESTAVRQRLPVISRPWVIKMTPATDLKPRQIVLLRCDAVTRHS